MTPWTIAHQASLSMEYSRPEYWNGVPFPSPEDLPDPGMKSDPPALQSDSLMSEPPGSQLYTYIADIYIYVIYVYIYIYIHISPLFKISFSFRSLESIE